MSERGCLIIDDVHASLSRMTELGRHVVSASADTIRDAVLAYAARRNWFVLRHRTYVDWASEAVKRDENNWLVLDPLFPLDDLGDRVQGVRLTRRFDNNETVVVREYVLSGRSASADLSRISGNVGVIDDAAASGNTLKQIARLVAEAGGRIAQIRVAASARGAREALPMPARTAQWSEFVRGDWRIIHLRDGCPHLAFSGRPTDQVPVPGVDGAPVEIRVLSSAVDGNLWQVLCMDRAVRDAVAAARLDVARRFDAAMGRPACVRDVCLLGAVAPAVVKQGEIVTGDTPLMSLLDSVSSQSLAR